MSDHPELTTTTRRETREMPEKARPTPRQSAALAKQRTLRDSMRSWLEGRVVAAAVKRQQQKQARPTPVTAGNGVTRQMRHVRKPRPEWVVRYRGTGPHEPYRKVLEELEGNPKASRQLRRELRHEVQ